MHTVFGIRGIKEKVDKFINELSTRYLAFNRYDSEKKVMKRELLQMRVCPIQLWDVSFPSEHKDAVLNHIYGDGGGLPIHSRMNKFAFLVRKVLGLKPLPNYKKDHQLMMCRPEDVEICAFGVKEDYWINEKGEHTDEKHKTANSYEGI